MEIKGYSFVTNHPLFKVHVKGDGSINWETGTRGVMHAVDVEAL